MAGIRGLRDPQPGCPERHRALAPHHAAPGPRARAGRALRGRCHVATAHAEAIAEALSSAGQPVTEMRRLPESGIESRRYAAATAAGGRLDVGASTGISRQPVPCTGCTASCGCRTRSPAGRRSRRTRAVGAQGAHGLRRAGRRSADSAPPRPGPGGPGSHRDRHRGMWPGRPSPEMGDALSDAELGAPGTRCSGCTHTGSPPGAHRGPYPPRWRWARGASRPGSGDVAASDLQLRLDLSQLIAELAHAGPARAGSADMALRKVGANELISVVPLLQPVGALRVDEDVPCAATRTCLSEAEEAGAGGRA